MSGLFIAAAAWQFFTLIVSANVAKTAGQRTFGILAHGLVLVLLVFGAVCL